MKSFAGKLLEDFDQDNYPEIYDAFETLLKKNYSIVQDIHSTNIEYRSYACKIDFSVDLPGGILRNSAISIGANDIGITLKSKLQVFFLDDYESENEMILAAVDWFMNNIPKGYESTEHLKDVVAPKMGKFLDELLTRLLETEQFSGLKSYEGVFRQIKSKSPRITNDELISAVLQTMSQLVPGFRSFVRKNFFDYDPQTIPDIPVLRDAVKNYTGL